LSRLYLEYERTTPGQDFNDKEAEVFQVDVKTVTTAADVAKPSVSCGNQM
jgi:aquaporin related protein